MRSSAVVFLALALCACADPRPDSQAPDRIESPDRPRAMAIEDAVERASAHASVGRALWPGFDPMSVPLAIYDGRKTYLFRHPGPPETFKPTGEFGSGVHVMDGRHENVVANSNAEIGGVPTATLLLDSAGAHVSAQALAAVAIHEAFHVYQREHHPGWIGNEADLFIYPTDSVELLSLRRQETGALRNALQEQSAQARACWARRAISLRDRRYAQMEPAFAAYERGTELNEGLATYVQMRVEGRTAVELPAIEFKPSAVRQRAYATGPALAMLLDGFDPGWTSSFESNDSQTLDQALAKAIGKGRTCSFEDSFLSATKAGAKADVAALGEERKRLLADFDALPGWKLIIEADTGSPLWPQGFDPINVELLGKARVLHTRFVTVGNDSGRIEVLNAKALTRGAGAHPLFEGVDRLEVRGLEKPKVVNTGRGVEVSGPGVSGRFKPARVEVSGSMIRIFLIK